MLAEWTYQVCVQRRILRALRSGEVVGLRRGADSDGEERGWGRGGYTGRRATRPETPSDAERRQARSELIRWPVGSSNATPQLA